MFIIHSVNSGWISEFILIFPKKLRKSIENSDSFNLNSQREIFFKEKLIFLIDLIII